MKNKIVFFLLLSYILFIFSGCSTKTNAANKQLDTFNIKQIDDKAAESLKQYENQRGITIVLVENKAGVLYGFYAKGHADYAPKGEDIVCAGVSALTINTVNSVITLTKDKNEHEIGESGYAKLVLPELRDGYGSREAIVLLKSFKSGIESIIQSYGTEYVRIEKMVY